MFYSIIDIHFVFIYSQDAKRYLKKVGERERQNFFIYLLNFID